MPSTMSLRLGDELLISGRLAAEAAGRSTAQQIAYWAKLGRELERSGSVTLREIAEVLAGGRSYDDLDAKTQALVRAEWAERIEARREALDLAATFADEGRSWVELDTDGNVVRRPATKPPPKQPSKPAAPKKAQKKAASRSR